MSATAAVPETLMNQYREASQRLSRAGTAVAQAAPEYDIRLTYGVTEEANPIAPAVSGVRGGANMYGANSIQVFATGDGGLSYTHADADGWANYVARFTPLNFRFRDAAVSTWEYLDPWDDWQDTYGVDAVRAFYHSGHGGMDNNGVFFAPLGAAWGGRGAYARSDQMSFSNQHVRYLFLSTCFSCRVLGGQNPIRTWNHGNNGLRMLFGYETVSVDAGNYGSAFWNHWNRNKSFSQAWLDASWYDISTHQAPSAFACGANSTEATDRLYNERLFYGNAASKNWYQWRWYYAAASAMAQRDANRKLPARIALAHLEPRSVTSARVRDLFNRLPLDMAIPRDMTARPESGFAIGDVHNRISIAPDGSFDAAFAKANRDNQQAPTAQAAISAASAFVRQIGSDGEGMQFDRLIHNWESGGSAEGTGALTPARITETVVQFTQTINGLPVVTPGQGKVIVRLDNDQRILGVADTTRTVAGLVDQVASTPLPPGAPQTSESGSTPSVDPEDVAALGWNRQMKSFLLNGGVPRASSPVPGSFEVGYSIRGNTAVLVVRQEVEVDFGHGLLKRYVVEEPLAI